MNDNTNSTVEEQKSFFERFSNKADEKMAVAINKIGLTFMELGDILPVLGKHSPISVAGVNRRVEVFDADIFTKVVNDCPEPIVISMSNEEIRQEMKRVQNVVDKVTKANGLQSVKAVQIEAFNNMASNGYHILANPLCTHQMSDAGLAYIVGHELAHHYCKHKELNATLCEAMNNVNKGLGMDDSDNSLVLSQAKFFEMEADKYGSLFAYRAGFPKEGATEFFLSEKWDTLDTRVKSQIDPSYDKVHPGPEERVQLIRDVFTNIDSMSFSPDEFSLRVDILNGYLQQENLSEEQRFQNSLKVEKAISHLIIPSLKREKELYEQQMDSILSLPKEEKIKLSSFLKDSAEALEKNKVDTKTLMESRSAQKEGKEDILSHRAEVVSYALGREEKFKDTVQQIFSSISEDDKKELYKKKLLNISKSKLYGEKIKRGISIGVDKAFDGIVYPIVIPIDATIKAAKALQKVRAETIKNRVIAGTYEKLSQYVQGKNIEDKVYPRFSLPARAANLSLVSHSSSKVQKFERE